MVLNLFLLVKCDKYLIIMKKIFYFLLLVFSESLFAQDEIIIHSPVHLGTNDTVWILKPATYDSSKRYPVVYLMHGHGGSYKNYFQDKKFQDIADLYDFILVTPDGFKDCWYIDAPQKGEKQFETFFIQELLPTVERHYSIDDNNRFITGISMGGHGAMWLFLRHPNLFKSAGSCSGVLDLKYSGNVKGSLSRLLGDFAEGKNKNFCDYSCVSQLENIVGEDKYIYFDCGTEDHLYSAAKLFRERCDILGIKACSVFSPGKHNGEYFDDAFKAHFAFFAKQVKR